MKIIGVGETVYDIIFRNGQPQRAVAGGSAFNAMISLGRTTKVPLFFVTEIGDDRVGGMIREFLLENNISTEFVTVNKGTKSHISLAFLDDNNDADYTFYKDHASASISEHFPNIDADDLVLTGSFFSVNPKIRQQTRCCFERAHKVGATLYYDINFRRPHLQELPQIMPNIIENYKFASVVRGSMDDFEIIYGVRDAKKIYKDFVSPYCRTLIITDGVKPITVFCGDAECPLLYETKSIPENILKSTIGAGDNFNAGFIYGLSHLGVCVHDLCQEDWDRLIFMAQQFSQAVCASMDNYVCEGFLVDDGCNNL